MNQLRYSETVSHFNPWKTSFWPFKAQFVRRSYTFEDIKWQICALFFNPQSSTSINRKSLQYKTISYAKLTMAIRFWALRHFFLTLQKVCIRMQLFVRDKQEIWEVNSLENLYCVFVQMEGTKNCETRLQTRLTYIVIILPSDPHNSS